MALKIEYIKIGDLRAYEKNARTHSEEQVAQIANSITEFGFTNPVLVDEENELIAGHGRLEAAKSIGLIDVPAIRLVGLTDERKKALRIADNSIALNSGWDLDLLAEEIQDLDIVGFDMEVLGFDDDFLSDLLSFDLDGGGVDEEEEEGSGDDENLPELKPDPVSEHGDVWILGRHRVMCGDSTSIDDVEKLIDDNKIDMIFTDPPYGIEHSGKGISGATQGNDFEEIKGDQDVSVAIDTFNLCRGLWPDSMMIFWGANFYPSALPDGHGWLVWDKNREGDMFSGAELAFINGGVKVDIFRHTWHGMIKDSEHGEKRVHPTQKPVALAEWCFDKYGKPDTVLDLFGGSGSTLIACENTDRKCLMMELDPKYVDVIIQRWQKKTGRIARLESTGETFNELYAERVGDE